MGSSSGLQATAPERERRDKGGMQTTWERRQLMLLLRETGMKASVQNPVVSQRKALERNSWACSE